MSRVAAALLCSAILTTCTSAKASETYRLCGPESTGFIRAGKHTACIGGSRDWQQKPAAAQQRPAAAATNNRPQVDKTAKGYNKDLDSSLNEAELRFREGRTESACGFVSFAITEANSSASAEQAAQVKDFAKRCNLRY